MAVIPFAGKAMLVNRAWFGALGVASPTPLPRAAGFKPKQMTTAARLYAATFGIREWLMVGIALAAAARGQDDRSTRRLLLAYAAVDGFDTLSALVAARDPDMRAAGVTTAIGGVVNAAGDLIWASRLS